MRVRRRPVGGVLLRSAGVALLRLDKELTACTDERCVVEVAARGTPLAGEAAAAVDDMLAGLPADEPIPPCLPRALRDMRRAFESAGSAMQALERFDVATAERESLRASELSAQAQEDLAACIGSARS